MKLALLLPFVLLLGLIIGGWAPREELRAAQKQVSDLSAKLADKEKDSRMDMFTRFAKIPDRATQQKRPAAPPTLPGADKGAADAALPTNQVAEAAATNEPVRPRHHLFGPDRGKGNSQEDLRARIDEAKELWKTRVDVARAQWIDRLKLSQDQTAQFDESINNMNAQLYTAMQKLADELAASDAMTPETGIRTFNEMTSILVETYDNIGAALPEDQAGQAGGMELTDFIDPAITEPLITVQDKLNNMPHPHGPAVRIGR